MKKVMKIVCIIILIIIVMLEAAFVFYWYRNIHWYDKYEKALDKVLLLIHGQMSIWEDYALVLPELSKNWHIYAVDVFAHGESSHDDGLYYLDVNGDDLIWFIDHVIGGPTVGIRSFQWSNYGSLYRSIRQQ